MSKKKEARSKEILNLIAEKKKIEVVSLSALLNVSQVTVRKDLDELEARGFIRRVHGCAVLNSTDDISGRLAYHYDEKKDIAEEAAKLIQDGDTIMIESGSCCAILATVLAASKRDLTIVTNSAFIAEYLRDYANIQVILLGGIYQKVSQCLVGPMIHDGASNYHVKYFFIGTDGWSEQTGFTNKDQMRAQAVRDMAHSCEQLIVLTESEKFSVPGTVPLNIPHQPCMVITDDKVPEEIVAYMEDQGITVMTKQNHTDGDSRHVFSAADGRE